MVYSNINGTVFYKENGHVDQEDIGYESTLYELEVYGKKVLIVAHGNSLRALVKYLDKISDEDILKLNIPTGVPFVYELDDNLHPTKSYYLGNQDEILKKAQAVASQGKKN